MPLHSSGLRKLVKHEMGVGCPRPTVRGPLRELHRLHLSGLCCHLVKYRVMYNEIITLYVVLVMSLSKSGFRHQMNFVCHYEYNCRLEYVVRSVTVIKECF